MCLFFLPLVQKYSCRDSPRSYWHFPCLELSPSHTTGVVDMLVCMLLHPIYPPKKAALVSKVNGETYNMYKFKVIIMCICMLIAQLCKI